ncbi:MAG: helix-turn-helix domain-containing protein [Parvibaculaceae bacterium]|nr:helix-turn-helix domain-containing protein [Parvibaculaceae bacterium]
MLEKTNIALSQSPESECRRVPLLGQINEDGQARSFRPGGLPWEIYRVLRDCATGGKTTPTNAEIAARFDVPPGDVVNALSRLCKAGLMVMETRHKQPGERSGERCFVFPDEAVTGWGLYATPQDKARRMRRRCMCCGNSFKSEGIHNRLCKTCKTKGD